MCRPCCGATRTTSAAQICSKRMEQARAVKEQPELFLRQDTKRKLVPCWLMSSQINPGQFGSRMCREQLRSEQVLPEASRADRLAYDPERNTLQVSRREKRTPWGAWPAVQRRSSGGAGMIRTPA